MAHGGERTARAARHPLAATPTYDTVILRRGVSCGASPVAHLGGLPGVLYVSSRPHHLHTRTHGQQKRELLELFGIENLSLSHGQEPGPRQEPHGIQSALSSFSQLPFPSL